MPKLTLYPEEPAGFYTFCLFTRPADKRKYPERVSQERTESQTNQFDDHQKSLMRVNSVSYGQRMLLDYSSNLNTRNN
jgi:hypothetical protein